MDLGASWVSGEEGNCVFEIVWPLGLLGRRNDLNPRDKLFDSSGNELAESVIDNLNQFDDENEEEFMEYITENENASTGIYYKNKYYTYSIVNLVLQIVFFIFIAIKRMKIILSRVT